MEKVISVTYISAFLGGLTSFFSPCIIPVLPVYFGFLSGDFEAKNKKQLYVNAIAFALGLSFINVILGAVAGSVGSIFFANKILLTKVAGIFIILMGIYQTGLVKLPFLAKERKIHVKMSKSRFISAFLMGFVFSFGWTPCLTPILAPILALVASTGSALHGTVALSMYSVGFIVPFVISSFFIGGIMEWVNRSEKTLNRIKIASGIILIILGIILYTNKLYLLILG